MIFVEIAISTIAFLLMEWIFRMSPKTGWWISGACMALLFFGFLLGIWK